MSKRYQEAIDTIAKINDPPNDVRVIPAASKVQLGIADAESEMAEFSKNDPEWSIEKADDRNFEVPGDRDHWIEGLRKAKLKENAESPKTFFFLSAVGWRVAAVGAEFVSSTSVHSAISNANASCSR